MKKDLRRIFIKFLMPYLIIIAIFVLLSSVVFYYASREIEENTLHMQKTYMNQTKAFVDSRLKDAIDIAIQIKNIPLVEAYTVRSSKELEADNFISVQLIKQLDNYKIVNDTVKEF